jgi:hypothetical protein
MARKFGGTVQVDPTDIKSWRELLQITCAVTGERVEDLICTLSEGEMHLPFDAGYTGTPGKPFTAWGRNYVYFPLSFDRMQWVGYAPRNPCKIAMEQQDYPNWRGSI